VCPPGVRGPSHRPDPEPLADLLVLTIPSSDTAFRAQVERLIADEAPATPEELEERLRRLFPRALVRRRDITGESPTWYVYRDGGWRSDLLGSWWEEPDLPRLVVTTDGWVVEANATARGLLGIDEADIGSRHFTDFVAPGLLDDSMSMFQIVAEGNPLTATIVLRPTSGDVIAIDIPAWLEDGRLIGLFRLADDVDVIVQPVAASGPRSMTYAPATDAAFRGYVDLAMARMADPTTEGLAMRLRRLYPHARVDATEDGWFVRRDGEVTDDGASADPWWADESLPRVRYDSQALILEANAAAEALLGRSMVGHHWQEFVTPGSTEQVSAMLAILAEVGQAESRFRMPRADGSLLEFDSWTEVDGDGFTTVMRPRAEDYGLNA
jgi:PAS domain-containing protein